MKVIGVNFFLKHSVEWYNFQWYLQLLTDRKPNSAIFNELEWPLDHNLRTPIIRRWISQKTVQDRDIVKMEYNNLHVPYSTV